MSSFQQSVAKPRTSKSHKNLLDGGRKDLIKHGHPFNQARPIDKSNAFVAKEEHSADPDEDLEEVSSMSGGSVEGTAGGFIGLDTKKENEKHKKDLKKKKNEVIEMQSREEMVNELKLRSNIAKMLDIQKKRMISETISKFNNHFRLRKVISGLISESDVEKNPHASTGINKLEVLLKKIVPTLEDSYKTLTTDKEQRSSFRSHILNAIENALRPEDAKELADADDKPQDLEEVEINIKDSDPLGASDEDKFIDISDSEGGDTEEEEDPLDSFGIEGEDLTGRDEAFEAFNQIENQIIDAYGVLQNPNDREIFYDYLLTNIKMYFDKFEDELAPTVMEPSSDSYEEEAPQEDSLEPAM
jgi:hypothetical protein